MASEYNNQKCHNIQSSPHSQPPMQVKREANSQQEPGIYMFTKTLCLMLALLDNSSWNDQQFMVVYVESVAQNKLKIHSPLSTIPQNSLPF